MRLKYCTRCVMPDTKPDLHLDAGRRLQRLPQLRRTARRSTGIRAARSSKSSSSVTAPRMRTNWDCIVPVSGGKDSTYQVIRMLQLGLNPLCVTATTCDLSDIGRRNIENIKHLGVDYVEISPNPSCARSSTASA